MKALILAAGFGTRLRPYTLTYPKCLFTLNRRPLLDILIRRLVDAGCQAVMVNTHHLHEKIERFIAAQSYPIAVATRHEPDILGTAGAIRNLREFWGDRPFVVVNSDIVTDIDMAAVYRFHLDCNPAATLALTDYPPINTVWVDAGEDIMGFGDHDRGLTRAGFRQMTFTGIQVLNAEVLQDIPEGRFYSSIDVFKTLLARGKRIKAYCASRHYWHDIGTPTRYRQAAFEYMAPRAFEAAWPAHPTGPIQQIKLKGDGSDRRWYRLISGRRSLVMADHGVGGNPKTSEAASFVAIGRHLRVNEIPVPEIYLYDTFSGLVFLQDLGDTNLQQAVSKAPNRTAVLTRYQQIIRMLVRMSLRGHQQFDPRWAYQTPRYDRSVILESECRYFVEAFLNGYCGLRMDYDMFADEFTFLADTIIGNAYWGFMHRDFQSRNIMIHADRCYFIDFQAGRMGPIQYDLAALLIDPYVQLAEPIKARLVETCIDAYQRHASCDPAVFETGYRYCALTRNLQILGAFGFLTKEKGKSQFESYIPAAVRSLTTLLSRFEPNDFKNLRQTANQLAATHG